MFNVKTYNTVAAEGIELLAQRGYILNESDQPDAILMRSQKIHDMVFPDSVVAIGRAGAGTNNIPVERCSEEGIVVFNAPGANANAVKELTIAMLINLARNVDPSITWTKSLRGDNVAECVEENKQQFRGRELIGTTLGVIGLGNIGSKVANAGVHLGMHVVGYDPYIKVKNAWEIQKDVHKLTGVNALFRMADFITIHTPATEETTKMIGQAAIDLAKDGVIIVNYAREEVVDIQAIKAGLDSGKIAAYATDFAVPELAAYENVLQTPHIGGTTGSAESNCATMAATSLVRFLETGEIKNAVNFPDVEMALHSPYRLSIINRNVPNMIGLISTGLANKGINIANIINRSQGEYAYNLVDLDEIDRALIDDVIKELEAAENILRVRLIINPVQ